MKSRYIIFEGAEGVGKSSLSQEFQKRIGAMWTFEPFVDGEKMPISYDLRKACKSKDPTMTPMARELMLLASRSMSLYGEVLPKVVAGNTLVSDRSFISGMVYARIEGLPFWDWVHLVERTDIPNLLDAVQRASERVCVVWVRSTDFRPVGGKDDRYDSRGRAFFERLELTYGDAFEFLDKSMFGYLVDNRMEFVNDMSQSIEANVDRLISDLEHKGW